LTIPHKNLEFIFILTEHKEELLCPHFILQFFKHIRAINFVHILSVVLR